MGEGVEEAEGRCCCCCWGGGARTGGDDGFGEVDGAGSAFGPVVADDGVVCTCGELDGGSTFTDGGVDASGDGVGAAGRAEGPG